MTRGRGMSHGVHAACPCRDRDSRQPERLLQLPLDCEAAERQGTGHGPPWQGATEASHGASANGAVPSILSLVRCSFKAGTADA